MRKKIRKQRLNQSARVRSDFPAGRSRTVRPAHATDTSITGSSGTLFISPFDSGRVWYGVRGRSTIAIWRPRRAPVCGAGLCRCADSLWRIRQRAGHRCDRRGRGIHQDARNHARTFTHVDPHASATSARAHRGQRRPGQLLRNRAHLGEPRVSGERVDERRRRDQPIR